MKLVRILFLVFLAVVALSTIYAQKSDIFIPTEILEAYEKGTRSYDGKPGEKYWHNTVDYQIEVEVIPDEQRLEGTETATYYNNSPDELNELVIRLYHDVFRKANPRAYRVRPDDITEGVEVKRLVINGEEYPVEGNRAVRRSNTNLRVRLNQPLAAGDKLTFEFDWAQEIPFTTVRTGAYDSSTFFIAYWYPQVAVYDDIFGWDLLDYDFSAEFYNNLANYDVKITAPKDFTVLSTGVLQNAAEILPKPQLERYQRAKTATETIAIISPEEEQGGYENKSGTWHYVAEEVNDFSFCLSDHYCWDAASQKVEDRDVLISSFYPVEMAESCGELTSIQQKTMKHFSEDVPGIPYPYPEFTTFIAQGGGGMETPMMANNGNPGRGVTIHEMFHTYFPMYVRVNEKRFAWMDEGWAQYNTSVVNNRFFEENSEPVISEFAMQISGNVGTLSDLPLITSTQYLDGSNYGYASYALPAFVYAMMEDELGEETFLKCYREYIRRWAQKSPTPYDFFFTFEDVSGQDLSWLWNSWFFEYGAADLKLAAFEDGNITVEKLGARPVPVRIEIQYADGSQETASMKASAWANGDSFMRQVPNPKEVKSISVNAGMPDREPLDNYYPPIKERYANSKISKQILGVYQFNEFPVTATIGEKDGMITFEVPAQNYKGYILPAGDNTFESLDGNVKIQFDMEDDKVKGMSLQVPGMNLTANKM